MIQLLKNFQVICFHLKQCELDIHLSLVTSAEKWKRNQNKETYI